MSNHGNNWISLDFDNTSRSYNKCHKVSSKNIDKLAKVNDIQVTSNDATSAYRGGTVEGDTLYLGTFDSGELMEVAPDIFTSDTQANNSGSTEAPTLKSINFHNGTINWSVPVENYTGFPDDHARSAPLIVGDLLITGTTKARLQTFDGIQEYYSIFSGQGYTTSGSPPKVLAVNKHTGSLVWSVDAVPKATKFGDPYNLATVAGPPQLVKNVLYQGRREDMVLISTSSSQSYYGSLITFDNNASLFANEPRMGMFRNRLSKTANDPQDPHGKAVLNRKFSDVGRLLMIRVRDGKIIKYSSYGPHLFEEGEVLDNSKSVEQGGGFLRTDGNDTASHTVIEYIPGEDDISGPLYDNSDSNHVKFLGRQEVVITLMANTLKYDNQGNKILATIPDFLDGLEVIDIDGNQMTLEGGGDIHPADTVYNPLDTEPKHPLEGLVVTLRCEFYVDQNDGVIRARSFEDVKGNDLSTVIPDGKAVSEMELLGIPTSSDKCARISGRIIKYLKNGDTLNYQDAYQMNYYGASGWSACPSVKYDPIGRPLEAYAATGQAHKIPYDEVLAMKDPDFLRVRFPGTGNSNFAPSITNSTAQKYASYIDYYWTAFEKQQQYLANPNDTTLRDEVLALQQELKPFHQRFDDVPLCPRSDRFHFDSLIAYDLRDGHLLEPIWQFKQTRYDVWGLHHTACSVRASGPTPDPQNPAGLYTRLNSKDGVYPWKGVPLITDTDKFFCCERGPDADLAASPALTEQSASRCLISMATKASFGLVFDLGPVTHGKRSVKNIKHWNVLGWGSQLGGSNYHDTADDKAYYCVQRNFASQFYYGLLHDYYQGSVSGCLTKFNRQITPPLYWLAKPDAQSDYQIFPEAQSYFTKFLHSTGEVEYNRPVLELGPSTYTIIVPALASGIGQFPNRVIPINTLPHLTSNCDLVFFGDGAGNVQVRNKSDGKRVVPDFEFTETFDGVTKSREGGPAAVLLTDTYALVLPGYQTQETSMGLSWGGGKDVHVLKVPDEHAIKYCKPGGGKWYQ